MVFNKYSFCNSALETYKHLSFDCYKVKDIGKALEKWILDKTRIKRKEGNVLFNDALNTFYFTVIWRRTYGKGSLR